MQYHQKARPAEATSMNLRLNPALLALGGLIIVTISRIHQEFGFLAVFRPGLLFTFICVGYAFLQPGTVHWRNLTASSPTKRLLTVTAIALLSAPFGLSLGGSGSFILESYSRVVVFFLLMVIAQKTLAHTRFLVNSYVIATALLACFSLFFFDMRDFGGYERMYSRNMYDANDLAPLLGLGLPFGLLTYQTSRGIMKWIAAFAVIAIPVTVTLTGSRGGFLTLVVLFIALLFLMPGVSFAKRVGWVVISGIAVTLFAPRGYWNQMATMLNPSEDYNMTSESGRVEIWKRGIYYMSQRPILGVGPSNFQRAEYTMSPLLEDRVAGTGLAVMSPHNTFIEVGAELGLPALLLWLSIVYAGIVGLTKVRQRLPKSWKDGTPERRFLYLATAYLPVSFLAWATGAFFVTHAYTAEFYILTAVFGGVLIFLAKEMRSERELRAGLTPKRMGAPRAPASTSVTGHRVG